MRLYLLLIFYHINMNAGPYLKEIARRFHDVGIDAVMIENAAAAINGA